MNCTRETGQPHDVRELVKLAKNCCALVIGSTTKTRPITVPLYMNVLKTDAIHTYTPPCKANALTDLIQNRKQENADSVSPRLLCLPLLSRLCYNHTTQTLTRNIHWCVNKMRTAIRTSTHIHNRQLPHAQPIKVPT